MQVRNSNMAINASNRFSNSPQSFGFHLAGEPAELLNVLQKESPGYFKWVSNRMTTNYAKENSQAASDIMDFYLYNGLIRSCCIMVKNEPSSAFIYKGKIKEFSQKAKDLLMEINIAKEKNSSVFNLNRIHEVIGNKTEPESRKIDLVV